ncbi:MAG: hypothetical protein ACE5FC_11000, partial [Myxococcota bacterium]
MQADNMPPPEKLAKFFLASLVVYAVLMAPWPGLQRGYAAVFRAAGNVCLSRFWFWPQSSVRFMDIRSIRPGDLAPGAPEFAPTAEMDTLMELRTRGTPQVGYLRTSSRYVGYSPMVLMVALLVATPLPWPRRARALLWGMLLIHAFIALRVTLTLTANGFAADKAYALFHPGRFVTGLLTRTETILSDDPAASYVIPVFIWLLVAFRPRLWNWTTAMREK